MDSLQVFWRIDGDKAVKYFSVEEATEAASLLARDTGKVYTVMQSVRVVVPKFEVVISNMKEIADGNV